MVSKTIPRNRAKGGSPGNAKQAVKAKAPVKIPTKAAKSHPQRAGAKSGPSGKLPPAIPPRRRNPKAANEASAKGRNLKQWTPAEIEEAFRRFHAANPEPRGELEHVNTYTLLVAVALSAQATDAGVNKATRSLFAVVDTPQKMVALGEEKLRDAIKTIGLYRTKAKNVIALSQQLIAEHGGEVPRDRSALEALPGVGRKTANVVLNIAFGEPTIAVDTHIFRIGNRTGLAPGKTPLEVETRLEQAVPDAYKRHAHHWLILHGRYICKAGKPACDRCLIADLCRWPDKTV
ncbi:MAG TPA: endonuclease III [Xanthobacteraceae bacterium]|jgi:endonuclease-3|nr:endonuclease III [Xanthobacteraceae bacterium]